MSAPRTRVAPPIVATAFAGTAARTGWAVLLLAAFLAPLPFLTNLPSFRELIWFGDDLGLIGDLDRRGYVPWIFANFAESFAPAFKLVWGGTLLLADGRHMTILTVCWITHVLNVVLFGRVLLRAGFSPPATLASITTFGLAWPHVESLGWSCQLAPLMAITFLFLGWSALLDLWRNADASPARCTTIYLAGITLSALSFVRGVLSGLVFVPAILARPFLTRGARAQPWLALASFGPAVLSSAFIIGQGAGNHQRPLADFAALLPQMTAWGATYFLANPLYQLLRLSGIGLGLIVALGACKVAVLALGFHVARRRPDVLLALGVLLLFDVGSAILLGIGRYHTGLLSAAGWRYQYAALVCFAPFAGLVATAPLRARGRVAYVVAAGVLAAWLTWITRPWPLEAARWAEWRGTQGRRILLAASDTEAAAAPPWIGIPGSMSVPEARRLARTFHLR